MKKNNFLIAACLLLTSVFLITSCDKNTSSLKGAGQQIVKILSDGNDGYNGNLIAFSPSASDLDVIATEIRREAANAAENDKPLTVKITQSATLLADYNAASGNSYVVLPDNYYQILTPGITKSGTTWTVEFAAGEFSKPLKLRLKRALFSFTLQYGLALDITDPGGAQKHGDLGNSVTGFLAKNKYDGKYRLDFLFYHPAANPGYTGQTVDVELHTSGISSVKQYVTAFGGYYGPIINGGTLTAFGAQEPAYAIDEATNKVTCSNSFSGAVTFYTTMTAASGYDSRYDPATKKFYVRYGYNYSAGPVFNPAATREWTNVLTYVGPR